jgi:hypothetical protein
MSAKALAGFRRLTRSAKYVFAADKHAYLQAKVALRAAFLENKNVTDKNQLGLLFIIT